jgi:hypothetical protein
LLLRVLVKAGSPKKRLIQLLTCEKTEYAALIQPTILDQGSGGWQHFHGWHCSTTQTFLLSASRVLRSRCAKGESMSWDSCFIAWRNPDSVPGYTPILTQWIGCDCFPVLVL